MASFVFGSGQSMRRIFFFFMLFSFSIWFTAPPNEQLLLTADGHFGSDPNSGNLKAILNEPYITSASHKNQQLLRELKETPPQKKPTGF